MLMQRLSRNFDILKLWLACAETFEIAKAAVHALIFSSLHTAQSAAGRAELVAMGDEL
jgi:hypothetical protein